MSIALLISVSICALPEPLAPGEPDPGETAVSIGSADLPACFAGLTAWLKAKTPRDPGGISETALAAFLEDPVFHRTLDRRRFLEKHGVEGLARFAGASPGHAAFLAWILSDTEVMDLYLLGATPTGLAKRERDGDAIPVEALEIWKRIRDAHPDSTSGLYLKLAIATALAPPGSGSPGAGQAKPPVDPVKRYGHFESAHRRGELFPSFDGLTVWELGKVVQSGASDEDLAWAREMIDTWRPDLKIHELVVNSTSEVWRRNSPHPYTDYRSVLSGGGKCGPRSSWAVMICQAFGIPAIGVAQPSHACVAYKAADPRMEPQPVSSWKVGYGRGWQVSRLEGMSGPEFLAGVEQRSRAAEFSRVEHLRWLASALSPDGRAAAVMDVAYEIQRSAPAMKTDLAAWEKAEEADREPTPEAKAAKDPPDRRGGPIRVSPDGTRIEAAAFSDMSGIRVHDCSTGGNQVNFQKNLRESWVEYAIEVTAGGIYSLEMKVAAPNFDQVLDVKAGAGAPITVKVPNTTGLWGTTPAVEVALEKGEQALRISAPYQRGVAVRWLELKTKGN